MKERKNLIANLREHAQWAEANEWETPITLSDNLKEAADLIEQQAAKIDELKNAVKVLGQANSVLREKVPEWIPCSERLPDKYVDASGDLINFMAYMPEYGVDIANYSSQAKTWFCLGVPAKVTHWMPLPEPPEEVRDDE